MIQSCDHLGDKVICYYCYHQEQAEPVSTFYFVLQFGKEELILSDDHIKPATQVMKISFLLCGQFHRALSARKLHINLQLIYCSM